MGLMLHEGTLLVVDSVLAASENCCCDEVEPEHPCALEAANILINPDSDMTGCLDDTYDFAASVTEDFNYYYYSWTYEKQPPGVGTSLIFVLIICPKSGTGNVLLSVSIQIYSVPGGGNPYGRTYELNVPYATFVTGETYNVPATGPGNTGTSLCGIPSSYPDSVDVTVYVP